MFMMTQSILEKVKPTDIIQKPFKWACSSSCLTQNLYSELASSFPCFIGDTENYLSNKAHRLPARKAIEAEFVPTIWKDFIMYHTGKNFWMDILYKFKHEILTEHPNIEQIIGKPLEEATVGMRHLEPLFDINLDCQIVINTPVTTENPTSVRGPHLDRELKLFTALLYFRDDTDLSLGGELDLYEKVGDVVYYNHLVASESSNNLKVFATLPYMQNNMVCFINSINAIHGVSPRHKTNNIRRYVNFVVETKNPIFNIPQSKFASIYKNVA